MPFRRKFFFRFGFLLRAHSLAELFFMISDTGNRHSHMGEYTLLQYHSADKMSRANLFPFEP